MKNYDAKCMIKPFYSRVFLFVLFAFKRLAVEFLRAK